MHHLLNRGHREVVDADRSVQLLRRDRSRRSPQGRKGLQALAEMPHWSAGCAHPRQPDRDGGAGDGLGPAARHGPPASRRGPTTAPRAKPAPPAPAPSAQPARKWRAHPNAWTAGEEATLRRAALENWKPARPNTERAPDGPPALGAVDSGRLRAIRPLAKRLQILRRQARYPPQGARLCAPPGRTGRAADVALLRRMLTDPGESWESMGAALRRHPEAVRQSCLLMHGHRRLADLRTA